MNKKYFTDGISDETLADMLDRTLRFEKNQKAKGCVNYKMKFLNIIPMAACVLLVIGAINILPGILGRTTGAGSDGAGTPGAEINLPSDDYTADEPTEAVTEADPYAHVRFGETRDILLLEVEWHTPETYLTEVVEPFKNSIAGYETKDWYLELSDDEKLERDIWWNELELNEIINNNYFTARVINGKKFDEINYQVCYNDNNKPEFDSAGYLIFKIYPFTPYVQYCDENCDWQVKYFFHGEDAYMYVNSKDEYDELLTENIIPFCGDLLSRGLLTQAQHDYYTTYDPLDYYVDLFFN